MPLGTATGLAEKFGHDAFRRHAFGKRMRVFTIAGQNVVIPANSRNGAHGNRFLPDVEMAEATNLSHAVRLGRLLFEAPDQQHLVIEID